MNIENFFEVTLNRTARMIVLTAGTMFAIIFLSTIWQYFADVPNPKYLFTGVPQIFEYVALSAIALLCAFGIIFMLTFQAASFHEALSEATSKR